MSPRKLLLLTYHFPPSSASGSFRMLGFARHLSRLGWQVSVIAPDQVPWEPVDACLRQEIPAEVQIRHIPYPQSRTSKLARRFAPYGVWLPRAVRAVRRLFAEERPDVVLTSGPPQIVHLLGLYLKRLHALPWIADFRDPWVVGNRPKRRRWVHTWCAARCEKAILRHADLVVSNAPNACARLHSRYPESREKTVIITNGFDPERFPERTTRHERKTCLVHTGELYCGRDPRPFLVALRDFDRPLRVRFFGRTTEGDFNLHAEVRERRLDNIVELPGQVSYTESLRAMAAADILLLLDTPGRRVGVPAKMYEYFGAGAAVLALAERDGDTAWALRESGVLHRIAPPKDPERIRRALSELAECVASGQPMRVAPERLSAFTREATARALVEHLERIVEPALAAGQSGERAPAQSDRAPAQIPEMIESSRLEARKP